jgi:drug/metabolite transporter (DMT)-like permease
MLVALSAAGFGLMPVMALYAYASGLNVSTLLFLRFSLAAVILFGYLFVNGKSGFLNLTWRRMGLFFLLGGVFYALQSFFYFSAIRYMPVPLAVPVFYMYPVFVAIISHFINGERLAKGVVVAIAVCLLGVVLVVGRPGGDLKPAGVFYAAGAAAVYSFYILIGNRVALNAPPVTAASFITLFASLSFLTTGFSTGTLHFRLAGWLPVLGIAVVSTAMPVFSFLAGMNATGPTRASVISMLEPVVSIVGSLVVLQQNMTLVQAAGGLTVLTGAVSVVLATGKAGSGKKT